MLYVFLFTNLIIKSVFPLTVSHPWGWYFGSISFIFEIFFFGFFIFGTLILFRKYRICNDLRTKANLKYMLLVIIVGATPPSILSIILPRLGYFDLNWLGTVSEIIWIPIMAYAIFKYRQMDIRAVVTEVLAVGMTVIFFINIFIETPLGILGRIAPFIVFTALAAYLIKGVLRESIQKEKLTFLNLHLEQKVAEQTAEVRTAYDLEKRARKDLEKLNETKDQFIMITQHHLRTPVTGIRWELENMQSGAYGEIGTEYREAVDRMSTATSRLMRIVDDFLSITAIKVGTPILNIEKMSLKPIIDEVLDELNAEITHQNLTVNMETSPEHWPPLMIDRSKIHEVILIVIENAIRYNKNKGTIDVTTEMKEDHFELNIANTGIGFTETDKKRIEGSLFYRGDQAKTAHPIGMGIGLSVARAMMKAHGGSLTIHSDGNDKGANVSIIFPIK
ncbi:MAG: HAMP domain-containing sensor histidine kinase [Candidatus Paceibacterota bacterium]|jgi:signal transduction histidine kinase